MQELLQDHLAYFSLCLLSGEKVFIMFIITFKGKIKLSLDLSAEIQLVTWHGLLTYSRYRYLCISRGVYRFAVF